MRDLRLALNGFAFLAALAGAATAAGAQTAQAQFGVRATVTSTCRMVTGASSPAGVALAPAITSRPVATVSCTNGGRWILNAERREVVFTAAGDSRTIITVAF